MIRVALAPGEDSTMVLTVADDGIGMTAEQIERCFDRFWQAESTDVRRFGGTGIGLYVVRQLVHAMHGSVSAYAVEPQGLGFLVELPADAGHEIEAHPIAMTRLGAPGLPPHAATAPTATTPAVTPSLAGD